MVEPLSRITEHGLGAFAFLKKAYVRFDVLKDVLSIPVR